MNCRGDFRLFYHINCSDYDIFIIFTVMEYVKGIRVVITPTGGHNSASHVQCTQNAISKSSANYPLKQAILRREHATFRFLIDLPTSVVSMTLNPPYWTNRWIIADCLPMVPMYWTCGGMKALLTIEVPAKLAVPCRLALQMLSNHATCHQDRATANL